ncbi:hypothetical protein JCM5350_004501 [Sporobolomyces pararoseus]
MKSLTMPVRHLPPELLSAIFSNLTSSPSDLYQCLLASRSLYVLIKPFLYSHITIRTKEQRSNLSKVKEEDKQLVRKITILGDGRIKTKKIERHFKRDECTLGKNVVKDLLIGKLLDISVVEILHVRNVHEEPHGELAARYAYPKYKPALKLIELSIWGHQGGGGIWKVYLEKHIPSLRRLAYWLATTYDLQFLDDSADEDYFNPEMDDDEPKELIERKSLLPQSLPYSQLDVLIGSPPVKAQEIPHFPFDNYLALISVKQHQFVESYTAQFKSIRLLLDSDDVFLFHSFLENIAKSFSTTANRLATLYLSAYALSGVKHECKVILDDLKEKGMKIVLDVQQYTISSQSHSLFSSSFIRELENNGKLGSI